MYMEIIWLTSAYDLNFEFVRRYRINVCGMQQAYNFTVVQFRRLQWRPLAHQIETLFEILFFHFSTFSRIRYETFFHENFKILKKEACEWIKGCSNKRPDWRVIFFKTSIEYGRYCFKGTWCSWNPEGVGSWVVNAAWGPQVLQNPCGPVIYI